MWRYDFNTPASVQMQDVSASGDVSGSGDAYGGLVGYLEADRRGISIVSDFASGHLTVGEGSGEGVAVGLVGMVNSAEITQIGGLIGNVEAQSGETLRVDRSYATGSAPVERSFWDVDTSATTSATGSPTASDPTGSSTGDMTSSVIYTAAGWSIVGFTAGATVTGGSVWGQCPDLYPFLMWQPDRPSVCPGGNSSSNVVVPSTTTVPTAGSGGVRRQRHRVGGAKPDVRIAPRRRLFATCLHDRHHTPGPRGVDAGALRSRRSGWWQ